MPPPIAAPAPTAAVAPATANPHVMEAPLVNNNNNRGQPFNAARNVPVVEMKFEDIENYMVKKLKRESLELV